MEEDVKAVDKLLTLSQRQMLSLLRLSVTGVVDNCLMVCKVDWEKVYAEAEKQSVVGLCWGGIERLPKDRLPDMDMLMEWLGQAEYTKTQNEAVDKAIASVVSKFKDSGYDGVVLKGQGLARLYPQPELRTSGDIDYLVINSNDEELIKFSRQNNSEANAKYHHVDFGKVDDVEVELHYHPSWFYCPWRNRLFQQFCKDNLDNIETKYGFPTPSLAFNRVFVLVHIYRHLFTEGIGLRQILDYYFVLKSSVENPCENRTENLRDDILEGSSLRSSKSTQNLCKNPFWQQEKIETMQRLKELGMERFTAAVMWVLSESLKLKDECLLCEPNEKDGRFLLSEIMQSGNFGKHDKRYVMREGESFLHYALRKIIRNFRLFKFGPWEVICTPFWRLWHICWWMPRHNGSFSRFAL